MEKNIYKIGKELFITSDEEIRRDDLCMDTITKWIFRATRQIKEKHNFYQKIILTTDQDLIKDGVQAIPDEFLEWFVNNPSCERVEVKKGFADGSAYGYDFLSYKIIIPKEEPKQRGIFLMNATTTVIDTRKPKQER
jgi:hypothetical protein